MKTNRALSSDIFPNEDKFSHPFFQRFSPEATTPPLQLGDGVSKQYQFPTFYGDVTCAMAVFMCDYGRAKALMPRPEMNPVKMPGKRAVVIFSCYEYKNVMHIGPYNEIAMTIPIMVGEGFSPPILPLIMDFERKGYYVFSMPVTSLENQIRGEKIWGLPKVVEEIDISVGLDNCQTKAYDEQGNCYFDLKVPTIGKPKHFDESGFLYSVREGEMLKSQTNFLGDFNLNSNFSLLWKKGKKAAQPILTLGDSPRADLLKDLKIEENAFQFRFSKSINSSFDLPIQE